MKSRQQLKKREERTPFYEDTLRKYEISPRIYIGNLPASITKEQLSTLFKKFGKIVDIFIKNKLQNRSTTFCFLTFENVEQAISAIYMYSDTIQFGRKITVAFSKVRVNAPNNPRQKCCCACHKEPPAKKNDAALCKIEPTYRSRPNLSRSRLTDSFKSDQSLTFASSDEDSFRNKKQVMEEKVKRKEWQKNEEGEKVRPKWKCREKEQGMLAISTDISKSEISEDYYTYDAKPFSDFCLKREEE